MSLTSFDFDISATFISETASAKGGIIDSSACSSSQNVQEAQLPLKNRASVSNVFFVAKLLSIAVMTYNCVVGPERSIFSAMECISAFQVIQGR